MSFAKAWTEVVKAASVEGEDWEPDPGAYTVEVVKAKTEITKYGNELVRLRLRIVAGDHAGNGFDHVLFLNTEFGVKKSVDTLRALGLRVERVEKLEDLDRELQTLLGTKANITTDWDSEYLRVRVNDARPPARPAPTMGKPADAPL